MPTTAKKRSKKDATLENQPARKYHQGIGRRKNAIAGAKVFLSASHEANPEILINGKPHKTYFPLAELQEIVSAPLKAVSGSGVSKITAAVRGGGIRGQAEAVRLGISRALISINLDFKKPLRDLGYLTRDARIVERKKAGFRKARRAPQFSKR